MRRNDHLRIRNRDLNLHHRRLLLEPRDGRDRRQGWEEADRRVWRVAHRRGKLTLRCEVVVRGRSAELTRPFEPSTGCAGYDRWLVLDRPGRWTVRYWPRWVRPVAPSTDAPESHLPTACGISTVLVPLYLNEVAPPAIRGSVGMCCRSPASVMANAEPPPSQGCSRRSAFAVASSSLKSSPVRRANHTL